MFSFFFFLSKLATAVHPASLILFMAASFSASPGDFCTAGLGVWVEGIEQVTSILECYDVEKKKNSWGELWAIDANHIKFIVGATYDVLPTPVCN